MHRCPSLFKCSHYTPLLLWKTYTVIGFGNGKNLEENFHFYKKAASPYEGHVPLTVRIALPSVFPGNYTPHLSIKPQSFDLCLCASVLHLHLCCVSVSKMCPMGSEKSKRGYFLDLGMLERFSIYINSICSYALYHFSLLKVS